jgi:GMP synthase (glutamine-hydrolysing) A subunit
MAIRLSEVSAPDQARILILDFGSQYTQLIARRVREVGVYCEIHPFDVDAEFIRSFAPQGIILSGGPESVAGADTPRVDDAVIAADIPILGICYGMQALADKLGGTVEVSTHREFGYAEVSLSDHDGLLRGLGDSAGRLRVWMSHGDRVAALPPGFESVASSANAPLAAMAIAAAQATGRLRTSLLITSLEFAQRLAAIVCCLDCPVASIPLWWPHCCMRRLVISSFAFLWTTDCSASMKAIRSWTFSQGTSG